MNFAIAIPAFATNAAMIRSAGISFRDDATRSTLTRADPTVALNMLGRDHRRRTGSGRGPRSMRRWPRCSSTDDGLAVLGSSAAGGAQQYLRALVSGRDIHLWPSPIADRSECTTPRTRRWASRRSTPVAVPAHPRPPGRTGRRAVKSSTRNSSGTSTCLGVSRPQHVVRVRHHLDRRARAGRRAGCPAGR